MNRIHRHIRRGLIATLTGALAGAVAVPVLLIAAPLTAHAGPTCTSTITGPHTGVVNVAASQTLCITNAVQNGAVNVAPGGGLYVTSSTVTGAITLSSGFTQFSFCGSTTVRGAISATGASGVVLIGGSGVAGLVACPANTIDGAVTLNANSDGVQLANGSISGAVTASANTVPLGSGLLNTISANHIGGNLTCTTNVPAPNDAGVSNAVGGGRSGQTCAVSGF